MAMTDENFKEVVDALHKLGLESGDLGYAFWDKRIDELKAMREQSQKFETLTSERK
jgi:hypothetical protein